MAGDTTDGTHGFGYGVTGAQLRALIAARGLCPGCAGTRRQWCLRTRSSAACVVCAGETLATHANGADGAVVALAAGTCSIAVAVEDLAAD
jgi:hypothetical protein